MKTMYTLLTKLQQVVGSNCEVLVFPVSNGAGGQAEELFGLAVRISWAGESGRRQIQRIISQEQMNQITGEDVLIGWLIRDVLAYVDSTSPPRHYTVTGAGVEFTRTVPEKDIKDFVRSVWEHPSRYSDYSDGSEEAYYSFVKLLWVEDPDGRETRLVEFYHEQCV